MIFRGDGSLAHSRSRTARERVCLTETEKRGIAVPQVASTAPIGADQMHEGLFCDVEYAF